VSVGRPISGFQDLDPRDPAQVCTAPCRFWRRRPLAVLVVLGVALAFSPGCAYFRRAEAPERGTLAALGAGESAAVRNVVQSEIMDFADQYMVRLAQVMDEFRDRVKTPEARVKAQAWKTGHANAAFIIAVNPNAFIGLMDLIVLVSLGRMVVEDSWMEVHGEDAQPVLEAYRGLEEEVWTLARTYLDDGQEAELRALIQEWRAAHPDQRYVSLIRFRDFAKVRRETSAAAGGKIESLFQLLYLDPFSRLEPAVRESEQIRSVGNRLLFQMQRLPSLLSWQAELLFYKLLRVPEVQTLTRDLDRFTGAAEEFSQTLKSLPAEVRGEHEKLLADLEAHAPALRGILADLKEALAEGSVTASAVEAAARSIGDLIPEKRPPGEEETTSPPRRPFDVKDYETAAAQISSAAERLTVLVGSLDRLIASSAWEERAGDVRQAVEEARAETTVLIYHGFLAGAGLIVILAVAGGAVIILRSRLSTPSHAGPRD
jgi:hypothetical protein